MATLVLVFGVATGAEAQETVDFGRLSASLKPGLGLERRIGHARTARCPAPEAVPTSQRASAKRERGWLGGRDSRDSVFVRLPPFALCRELFQMAQVSATWLLRPLSSACRLLLPMPARCHSK